MGTSKNILGLPPINPDDQFGFKAQINKDQANQTLSRGELRETNQDAVRRRLAIDINVANNEYAIQRLIHIDQKAYISFFNGTKNIVELNLDAQGTPYQKYTDPFCDRIIQEAAHQTLGLLNISAARIAYEVNRPPEPEQPKSIFGYLFGYRVIQ